MIPDVTYLILNYNPRGEETAQGILGETIRSFHERKSPRLKAEVYLLDQGTTGGHRRWLREQEARFGFSLFHLEENSNQRRITRLSYGEIAGGGAHYFRCDRHDGDGRGPV